jgi:hypothetical protein
LECPDTKAPADWARAYHTLLRLPAFAFRRILGPHWLSVCVLSILLTVWEIHHGWLRIDLYDVFLAALASLLVTGMHAILTVRFMLWIIGTLTIGIGFSWIASTWLARSVEWPIVDLIDWLATIQRGAYGVRADDVYPDEFARVLQGFNHLAGALEERQEANAQLLESNLVTPGSRAGCPRSVHCRPLATRGGIRGPHRRMRGFGQCSVRCIRRTGLLLDIDEIGIPDAILMKPGSVIPEE